MYPSSYTSSSSYDPYKPRPKSSQTDFSVVLGMGIIACISARGGHGGVLISTHGCSGSRGVVNVPACNSPPSLATCCLSACWCCSKEDHIIPFYSKRVPYSRAAVSVALPCGDVEVLRVTWMLDAPMVGGGACSAFSVTGSNAYSSMLMGPSLLLFSKSSDSLDSYASSSSSTSSCGILSSLRAGTPFSSIIHSSFLPR